MSKAHSSFGAMLTKLLRFPRQKVRRLPLTSFSTSADHTNRHQDGRVRSIFELDRSPAKRAQQFFQEECRKRNVVGAAVTVITPNGVAMHDTMGSLAVDDPCVSVSRKSIFQIGSLSKSILALGIGVLVDRRLIQWNDRVVDILPWFALKCPNATRKVTIANLLSMDAGFGRFQGDLALFAGIEQTERGLVERMRHLELVREPGSGHGYCNLVYVVLGQVIEAVAGLPWYEFLREHLFDPLGMNRTFAGIKCIPSGEKDVVAGHTSYGNSIYGPYDLSSSPKANIFPMGPHSLLAGGSLASCISDLEKILQLFLNDGYVNGSQLISARTIKDILSPRASIDPFFQSMGRVSGFDQLAQVHTGYGLDFVDAELEGESVFGKFGRSYMTKSFLCVAPQRKVAAAILFNSHACYPGSSMQLPFNLLSGIMRMFLGASDEVSKKAFDTAASIADKTVEPLQDALPSGYGAKMIDFDDYMPIPNEVAQRICGTYWSAVSRDFYGPMEVIPTLDGSLTLKYNSFGGQVHLVQHKPGSDRYVFAVESPHSASHLVVGRLLPMGRTTVEVQGQVFVQEH